MGFYINQYTSTNLTDVVIKDVYEDSSTWLIGKAYDKSMSGYVGYFAKIDTGGNPIWEWAYIFADQDVDDRDFGFYKIIKLESGNFVIMVKNADAVWLVWLDTLGTPLKRIKYYDKSDYIDSNDVFESDFLIQLKDNVLVLLVKEYIYNENLYLSSIVHRLIKIEGITGEILLTKYLNNGSGVYVNVNDYTIIDNDSIIFSSCSSSRNFAVIFSIDSDLNIGSSFRCSMADASIYFRIFSISKLSNGNLALLGGYSTQVYGESGNYLMAELNFSTQTVVNVANLNLTFSTTDTQNEIKHIFCKNEGIYLRNINSISYFSEALIPVWSKTLSGLNDFQMFKPSDGKVFVSSLDDDYVFGIIRDTFDSCRTAVRDNISLLSRLVVSLISYEISISSYKNIAYKADKEIKIYAIADTNVSVICPVEGGSIDIDKNTLLQSAHFYLQAAGSTGEDSTSGIHLRWILKNALAEHLPKGDYYQQVPSGLNKQDDYVKIFRAVYTPNPIPLVLTIAPTAIVDSESLWLYEVGSKKFYVYFRNSTQYEQIRSNVNPLMDPVRFLTRYGNNIIEIENKDSLFFAVDLDVSNTTGNVKTEVLSVETTGFNLPKYTTFRKNMSSTDMSSRILVENGRSVRFAAFNCFVTLIRFEFYDEFIYQANENTSWIELGKYSLSTVDEEVYQRLDPEPVSHPVHAVWPRYNDGEFVNINNYIEKWNGDLDDPRERIKDSVERYLSLSNDLSNPLANETYYLNDIEPDPEDETDNALEISHLMILQMASLDYHVARMLGLGILDFSNSVYGGGQYIYAAEYITEGDLEDGQGSREVKHLSLSLPTSLNDQRLSLPVILKEPVPGIISSETEVESGQVITDEDGYSHDGKVRYLSLFVNELTPDEPENSPFYYSSQEFDMSGFTYPVYVGIEYKAASDSGWRIPELPNDNNYQNINSQGVTSGNETAAIAIPEIGQPAFIHRETKSGIHVYGSYGVNWFSRATSTSTTWEVETNIKPTNPLLPPSNTNALLIQEESPLFLTSENEQIMLSQITQEDKTFIRLTFDYDAAQDMISYHKAIDEEILQDFSPLSDDDEIFADEIEIFFKPSIPNQVFGIVDSIADAPDNPLVAVIQSAEFTLESVGQIMYPTIAAAEIPNYIGGIFTSGGNEYIIHNIEIPSVTPALPVFHILKKQVGDAFGETGNAPYDPADFTVPEPEQSFMVSENMQNETSWGTVNPHPMKVQIGDNWGIQTEEVTITSGEGNDTAENTFFRKFRGFSYDFAIVNKYADDEFNPGFQGVYEIIFDGYTVGEHPQHTPDSSSGNFVQWYRGSIRIPYENNPEGELKTLKILRASEDSGSLVIYALDENYQTDPLQSSDYRATVKVNYYPGYRVYLYYNELCRLTEDDILPQDENVLEKYSIFGFRSRVTDSSDYISRISTPTLMFARKIEAPEVPGQPKGALYATRPDYFGRSTYTFTTEYTHKPYSVAFLRSNDDILLSSLYQQTPYGQQTIVDSVQDIQDKNNDEFYNNRLIDLANATVDENHLFPEYNGYRFPIPNQAELYNSINAFITEHNTYYGDTLPLISIGDITDMSYVVIPAVPNRNEQLTFYDFVKQTVVNTYVPLTEVPVIYQYIKGGDYRPIPKAQVIRDRNGVLLKPTDVDFDMAPMMKIVGTNPHKTLFTDFTLDGASTSVYFYKARETDAQMKQGDASPAVGPVKLVNSFAVRTPEIKSVIPVLENPVLGISPAMQVQINSYDSIHQIRKINLYRALNMGDATSVRSMTLVKTIDLEDEGLLESEIWTITDDFADLPEVPFSDPLYFRVTVEAKIEYAQANFDYDDQNPDNDFVIVVDYAPSEVSKLMISTITENVQPSSPALSYTADELDSETLENVILQWNKQAYKAKYYLYKMNNQGNWVKIANIQSNEDLIELALADTDWDSDQLTVQDSDGNRVYHHFKVITENTAGMMSSEENMLTIPESD